ncbi:2OG-Fe(II) oxygenase [Pseudomonas sp. N040]|uniref:2OG-Fe(II) oxygenase n=1 Tax=Pseudomonas sp. N040 TaxID=2785325 RepID=UPI0018A2B43F|nr:2OG-Fe(II) oxygenase [Pseudomonas sp. N040]MBF7730027.1 2OG-Fe(II) oxygenase [Pseudomonas sp. N040]MBW7013669.1 2OG-Fe(II) oxygenase [Pseudomonas sp. N040]
MNTLPADSLSKRLVDELAERGWTTTDSFLPPALTRALAAECRQRHALGLLAPAGVGRGTAQAVREAVRGDSIQWLEPGQAPATDAYLAALETLRQQLNRSLYLGLEDVESHFALYPPGAFYQKHLDRFRDDDRRALSVVFYLNDDWQAAEGGALRLHPAGQSTADLLPQAGRLVLFRSAELLHEVLPASRERLSLTGWFRRRGAGLF